MVFTALHRLLGRPPSDITAELIDAAVNARLAETDDLDWKSELPPLGAIPKSDFPKDIAAMANRGGGVIVYGVAEKDKQATERCDPGHFSERYESALRSAARSAISPPVFDLDVSEVWSESGQRAIVVVVPPSLDGPHLIFRNEYFGAPLRVDADTAWMKERQLEAAYRSRFEQRRHGVELLATLFSEAEVNRIPAGDRRALVAVSRPRLPQVAITSPPPVRSAHAIVDRAAVLSLGYAPRSPFVPDVVRPLEHLHRQPARPGLRRWRVAAPVGSTPHNPISTEVHHDGSVSLTVALRGQLLDGNSLASPHAVDSADVEAAVADFMALVRATAEQRELGAFDTRIGIVWTGKPLMIVTVDNFNHLFTANSNPLSRFTPVDLTVVADASDDDFHRQVYSVAQDCINQGGVANLRLIESPPPATN